MELPRRSPEDVYIPDGAYPELMHELRVASGSSDWSSVLYYCFDNHTRLMPFRWLDKRVVPCGVRTVAGCLLEAGFDQTRIVLQQWTPNFRPSATVRSGRKIDILLVSSMGLHAEQAYRIVRDAHALGEDRPLILIGGPKAIYEPEDCFSKPAEVIGGGVDAAVTGEVFILLELLRLLSSMAVGDERPLQVFRRARRSGLLDHIPGLVYRAPDHERDKPYLINTGVQRLMQDLDQLPMPLSGYTCVEPAHRGRTLREKPWPLADVRRKSFLSTLIVTHGCRFNCDFCPIPAYQQKTWRHKSPERIADEMKQLGETMDYRHFFGTDDSFFNDRQSAESILTAMANSNVNGRPFREAVHFSTEATEYDVHKNRDLLPLAHQAGMRLIFFGIEDLSAKLLNKGQTIDKTETLFREMRQQKVAPYAMMIHHDDQPLWSRDPERLGVINQALKLFNVGAIGYHTTYITPSMGARNIEKMYGSGQVFERVGRHPLPEAFYDGNHVIASRHRHPWIRQLQLQLAYLAFYNPINFTRTLFKDLRLKYRRRRLQWQVVGASMMVPSALKLLSYTLSLMTRRIHKHETTPPRGLPMVDSQTGERVKWAIDSEVPFEVTHTREADSTVALPIHAKHTCENVKIG
ncbi:MAG: radical SAM protein [Planctomycetaceae bacterium]